MVPTRWSRQSSWLAPDTYRSARNLVAADRPKTKQNGGLWSLRDHNPPFCFVWPSGLGLLTDHYRLHHVALLDLLGDV